MTYEEMAIKQQELMDRKEDLLNKIEENLGKAKFMYKYLSDPYNQACCELLCNTVSIISGTKFEE